VALLAACAATARADASLEQRVKAAFLYNFAKFTAWPADKLPAPDATIRFCVPQGDALAPALEEALAGKTIDEHPLQLRQVAQPADFRACNVAYLGALDSAPTLATLGDAGVLTVYEADATQRDGVVRFYLEDRKVRFEINAAAAEREHLQLSSHLLSVAKVVRE
jgi:hypothetical protein